MPHCVLGSVLLGEPDAPSPPGDRSEDVCAGEPKDEHAARISIAINFTEATAPLPHEPSAVEVA